MSVTVRNKQGYHVSVEPIHEWITPLRHKQDFKTVEEAKHAINRHIGTYDLMWGADQYVITEHGQKGLFRILGESVEAIWTNKFFDAVWKVGLGLSLVLLVVQGVMMGFAGAQPVVLPRVIISLLILTVVVGGIAAIVTATRYVTNELSKQKNRESDV